MPAPKNPNTSAATAAVIRRGHETMARKLREAGWATYSPDDPAEHVRVTKGHDGRLDVRGASPDPSVPNGGRLLGFARRCHGTDTWAITMQGQNIGSPLVFVDGELHARVYLLDHAYTYVAPVADQTAGVLAQRLAALGVNDATSA